MNLKALVIIVATSLFLSSAVQAGHKGRHDSHHYCGHQKKHHGHHKHHHGHKHRRVSHHNDYARHDRYARAYARPHIEVSARFDYSHGSAVIVYQPQLHGRVTY